MPSLVEQLDDYARGDFVDPYWDLTMKPVADLDVGEREFVVDFMCERSGHPRAQRYPRYLELSRKREAYLGRDIAVRTAAFSPNELRDLQIWFTLAWFDPVQLREGPLADLVSRGQDFTEADKQTLAAAQADILVRVLPAYRQAETEGRVELTTSPYFHPILPLLINTDISRISRVDAPLPPRRFAHPEDAREQIQLAVEHHAATFGRRPRGMWCSELGVGEDVVPMLTEAGLAWTIADEGILARSLGQDIVRTDTGHVQDPDRLYHPYRLDREGQSLDIVFRDRVLSDLIGFTYRSWAPGDAAANLVERLREIRQSAVDGEEPRLVTIALDGENAWEYYPDDGHQFLSGLYETLVGDPGFRCVTVSEFLADNPPRRELPWMHTGSWVFGDFSTWIGDPAHGPAWDLLHRARDRVAARREPDEVGAQRPAVAGTVADHRTVADLDEAWRHILIAEGSDWFWWFSTHQESGVDYQWDLAFRGHLQEAYRCLGENPPNEFFAPLLARDPSRESASPKDRFTPVIDGRISSPDEWANAGFRRAPAAGTMHTSEARILEEVQFGRDQECLYLLLVPGRGGFPRRNTSESVSRAAPVRRWAQRAGVRVRTVTRTGTDGGWSRLREREDVHPVELRGGWAPAFGGFPLCLRHRHRGGLTLCAPAGAPGRRPPWPPGHAALVLDSRVPRRHTRGTTARGRINRTRSRVTERACGSDRRHRRASSCAATMAVMLESVSGAVRTHHVSQ